EINMDMADEIMKEYFDFAAFYNSQEERNMNLQESITTSDK
ncbi:23135_t:CDS:2, partial [Dentiscutata erythropus]